MKQPVKVPKSLATYAEEARAANKMGDALLTSDGDQTYTTYARLQQTWEQAHRAERFRKANSYTLAEKYNLLDLFPPTVTVSTTKIA